MRWFAFVPVLVTGLVGQAPAPDALPRDPRPVPDKWVAEAKGAEIRGVFEDPEFVAFDEPVGAEEIWAVGRSYKAHFDTGGWRFFGRPAAGAEELAPIGFRLAAVRVGDTALAVDAAAPTRSERRVRFDHGDLEQTVDVTGAGVEQSFTFERLPERGEIVLEIAVATDLAATEEPDGIRFRGPFDEVTYSAAVAIDARGERVRAPTSFSASGITIRVPAEFVARARLPLVVDPWVTAIEAYPSPGGDLAEPDIAWDENGNLWAIVFSRYFGANDWDCYVQRVSRGNPMQLVGGPVVIDATTEGWQYPRIANASIYATFMIVAQVRSGTLPKRIIGRMMGNSGVLPTRQFIVRSSTVDLLHPDVGGNPAGPPPVYFTVVWEQAYSATDHDIYARQVESNGALRPVTSVQNNLANQSWPAISKSCGPTPAATQRFGIVYQDGADSSDRDVHGALMTWDGVLVPVSGANTFPISVGATDDDVFPQVSSPTIEHAGRRLLMAVYERRNFRNGDIVATCFDHNGTIRASGNISTLEYDNIGRANWPQHRPSVDCDGWRFPVAYHEVYNNNLTVNDLDTRLSLVALGGSELVLGERGVWLARSQDREFHVNVATRYSGSGQPSPQACTTNDRDTLLGGFAIDAHAYDGVPDGGFVTRMTGCGSLPIGSAGVPRLGTTISFAITPGTGVGGFLIGLPTTIPLPFCQGCTIGVDGGSVFGSSWLYTIPTNPAFIGFPFAIQGFSLDPSGGPCLGQIHLSNTVDVTVL